MRRAITVLVVITAGAAAFYQAIAPSEAVNQWISLGLFLGLVGFARLLEARFHFHQQVERRLDGLHRTSQLLGAHAESDEVLADFLTAVCLAFEGEYAELVVERSEGLVVRRVSASGRDSYVHALDAADPSGLRHQLMHLSGTARIGRSDKSPLAEALRTAGYRDCLASTLPGHERPGVLVIYNRSNIEGFDRGEIAVIEAMAREIAAAFEKGKLFAAIVEERYKLSRIVDSTYDGVLTLSAAGVIRSWNPGWEQITGIPTRDAVGHNIDQLIPLVHDDGTPAALSDWSSAYSPLPESLRVTDCLGSQRWLQCSYRAELDDVEGVGLLIVVAHDTTDEHEIEQLREDVDRLAELEAAQRARVLQVQESLQPGTPDIKEAQFGVFYQPSDTTAPTGGDFYDWQILPGGDVHVAVVDVLGSGIDATNDAFAVIHTLRTLAYQGIPVDQLVAECDNLMATLNPELVATVVVARYDPITGRARLAGGGHPPVLIVREDGRVEEVLAPGIPVGWPGAASEYPIDITLGQNDTMVLYTDGLIEAHRDILLGLQALSENAAQTRSVPVDDMARVLVERSLEGAARRDDSLALVVRHLGLAAGEGRFKQRGKPTAHDVPRIRHAFNRWMATQPLATDVQDDMAIVLTELITNSARLSESFFEVRAFISGDQLVLEVEDDGPGFSSGNTDDGGLASTPVSESESGRGLFIARALVDDLVIQHSARGCTVRAIEMIPTATGDKEWEQRYTVEV